MTKDPLANRPRHRAVRCQARLIQLLAVTVLAIPAALARGADLQTAEVDVTGDRYRLRTEVLIDAPAANVRALLADYQLLPQLNPNIEAVTVLADSPAGNTRMLLRTKTCVLFLCRRYEWIQEVETATHGDVIATVEPASSDFRRGIFHYRFRAVGDACLLVTEVDLELKEPLIAPWAQRSLMRNLLGHEAVTLSSRLEQLLAERPSSHARAPV